MDPFVNEKDYALLAQDRYTFAVLDRILRGQCDLIRANHDMERTLTEWYNYTGYSHPYGLDMKFMPSVKPVGIYNSWV